MRPPVPTPLAPSAGTLCCGNRNGTGPCAQALSEIAAANPRLAALVEDVLCDERYHKRYREKVHSRKTDSPLPLTDCYKAPCQDGGCPIHQRIPEYLKLTAVGELKEAFDAIAFDNTAPTILGVLCSEPCRDHCTRLDYEQAIDMLTAIANGDADKFHDLRRELL